MLRSLFSEVAQSRGAQRHDRRSHSRLVVFKAEFAGVLANDSDICPAEPLESLLRNLAQGGREVDEIDAGEEFRDVDMLGHGLDVPASAASDLYAT